MEELFPALIFFAIAIFSSISKSKQKQKSDAAKRARTRSTPPQRNPWTEMTAPAAAPARPASMASMLPPRETEPRESAPAAVPTPITPTVHVHEVFDCDDHDQVGSLNFTSQEGHDPCHEEQMGERSAIPAAAEEQPAALQLDWTANGLVRAMVMQEVLTRPSQRRSVR